MTCFSSFRHRLYAGAHSTVSVTRACERLSFYLRPVISYVTGHGSTSNGPLAEALAQVAPSSGKLDTLELAHSAHARLYFRKESIHSRRKVPGCAWSNYSTQYSGYFFFVFC